jgi:hypothetical protein
MRSIERSTLYCYYLFYSIYKQNQFQTHFNMKLFIDTIYNDEFVYKTFVEFDATETINIKELLELFLANIPDRECYEYLYNRSLDAFPYHRCMIRGKRLCDKDTILPLLAHNDKILWIPCANSVENEHEREYARENGHRFQIENDNLNENQNQNQNQNAIDVTLGNTGVNTLSSIMSQLMASQSQNYRIMLHNNTPCLFVQSGDVQENRVQDNNDEDTDHEFQSDEEDDDNGNENISFNININASDLANQNSIQDMIAMIASMYNLH